jgi:transcriptional regulator with XRE-family HTH domain
VARKTKKERPTSPLRGLVAQTVCVLRDRKYRRFDNVTDRNERLAKDADTSLSTIQRIAEGAVDVQLDTLYRIAMALDARPQDLLTPFLTAKPPVDLGSTHPEEVRSLHRR